MAHPSDAILAFVRGHSLRHLELASRKRQQAGPARSAGIESAQMLNRIVTTPDPYEPYLLSQGIRLGDLVFVSGQAGYGDDGRIVKGGFRRQGEQAFANLDRALLAGGASLASVAKVTIFVTDMAHFNEVVELRRKFFTTPYPADSIVEVKGLYTPDAMIEIEAVAAVAAEPGQ